MKYAKRVSAGSFLFLVRTGFAAAFLATVFGFGAATLLKRPHPSGAELAKAFPFKDKFVELNGLAARAAGRRMCNVAVKMDGGMLVRSCDVRCVKDDWKIKSAVRFSKWLAERGIEYAYVQFPCKMDMGLRLCPPCQENTAYAASDAFLEGLAENGVKFLDLRQLAATPEDVLAHFYRTDHHWNNDAVFKAFESVSAFLGAPADPSRWRRSVVPQALLGTIGRRTGRRFAGRLDDIVLYRPDFETHMSIEIPGRTDRIEGSFEETVMRNAGKIRPNGKLRARAYSLAYVGEIAGLTLHRNPSAPVRKKALIIGDSYVRPLEGFLSTVLTEIDVVDPRRYEDGSVADYVAATSPDMVLQMQNPVGLGQVSSEFFFRYGLPGEAEGTRQ